MLGARAGLVTCDMAPRLSGVRDRDQQAMTELLELALTSANEILKPGGAFVVKVFMNADLKPVVGRLKTVFSTVNLVRPQATRRGSSEMYVVASGFFSADGLCDRCAK